MTRTWRKRALLGGAMTLMGAWVARAQAADTSQDATLFGWSISARVSARVAPDYLGAKTYSFGPGGSLSFHRPGEQPTFKAPDDSPSLQFLGDKTLSAGAVVRPRSSRDGSGDLQGIHKVHLAFEPGVYVEWWPADGLRLHGELRRGVVGNQAWSGDLAADLVHDDPKWLLSVGPRLHLGDDRFTRTYFDITAADALRSPRGIDPFASNGAFESVGGVASAEYRWSPRWSLMADVSYQRLTGDAAKSPIVARLGSADQFTGAVGVRYRFGP